MKARFLVEELGGQHIEAPQSLAQLKRLLTWTITTYYDEVAPGWNYLPKDEREALARMLRQLAKDTLLKRGKMIDRAGAL